MDRGTISSRIAALRAECAALGRELVEHGRSLESQEAFEVAGELQGLVNAAEGAQAVAAALGARVETRLSGSGPVERTHPVGFVDGMAPCLLAMEVGLTEGLAGRTLRLGADLSSRFPRVRDLLVDGSVSASAGHKVLDACAGLDAEACARVDAELAGRLATMDPARVTSEARRVATRVAADQVAAQAEKTRRGRCVEVRAADDGLSEWSALLPTATSAAAWSAVEKLAGDYREIDETLSVPESRADALADLLLRNVTVSAQITLGVPVVTGTPAPDPGPTVREERADDDTITDHATGEAIRIRDLHPTSRETFRWVQLSAPTGHDEAGTELPPAGVFGQPMTITTLGADTRQPVAVSGTHLAGLGWVEPATLAGLLSTLPLDVARAVLDAHDGTQIHHATRAYRPPKSTRDSVTTRDGTCRMWGCTRPADRCDLDHVRPWPHGETAPDNLVALCRRHHRLKQHGHWRPTLHPDGTLTWTDPVGRTRTTQPLHRTQSPPGPETALAPSPSNTLQPVPF